MNWTNTRLIYCRELRDQLRDRRTLFTVFVLPLLLYPFLALTWFQMQQFLREKPSRVKVVGAAELPVKPPLIEGKQFAKEACDEELSRLLKLELQPGGEPPTPESAQAAISAGEYDALIYFPPDFAERLSRFRDGKASATTVDRRIPEPEIFVDSASDASKQAHGRLELVLSNWREKIVQDNLAQSDLPQETARPFELTSTDVSAAVRRRAALWSKVLPFVLLVWALTGAFYPAVDLCAGEKERGTLETLLVSPADRLEIVWGKLLTVITFSMATSLLNLACMGFTVTFLVQQMAKIAPPAMGLDLGPPPLMAVVWLVLALAPVSSLFSALSLAIAAFARSSKEGQYYLMPLLLTSLPLMMIALTPNVQLDAGFSLIPVTGVMLLLKTLIEGEYVQALRYGPLVILVTGGCCHLAIRWAVHQFNSESVLFRESERFNLSSWVRHVLRDRGDTPSPLEAMACAAILILIRFFANFMVPVPQQWREFAFSTVAVQLALIATPALLMAVMLTRKPLRTLLLQTPSTWLAVPAAALLAFLLHPTMFWVSQGIQVLYPISGETLRALEPMEKILREAPLTEMLLLIAVVPAICEELAFRGFILSGLRRSGHKWAAIVGTAMIFGVAHGLLQQSLAATVTGVVIGYIALKTNSLLPAVAYHCVHNGLGVLHARVAPQLLQEQPWGSFVWRMTSEGPVYTIPCTLVATAGALVILLWLKKLPYHLCAEERLQEALKSQANCLLSPPKAVMAGR